MKKNNINRALALLSLSFVLCVTSSFVALAAGPAPVNLLSAGNFVILSKSGITTTGTTSIIGDIGVSPIAATAMTGFGLTMDSSNTFSTAVAITGKAYATDYAFPTPTMMTTAINDMQTAYTEASNRTLPTATELGAGNIGGLTIAPGLYKWGTNVTIPTNITLSGGANDVWIFQIAQNLNISSAQKVLLSGGAQAGNIFWIVTGQTTLGTNSVFNGNILGKTAIVMNTGAILNGSALSQTAVTLDANKVTKSNATIPVTIIATPVITSTPSSVINQTNTLTTPAIVSTPTQTTAITTIPTNITTPTIVNTPTTTNTNSPRFPNTGFTNEDANTSFGLVMLFGILTISMLSILSRKMKKL